MSASNAALRQEAADYLEKSLPELYALMPVEQGAGSAKGFSLEAGRSVFEARLEEVKPAVCKAYWGRPVTLADAIDLTVLVVGVLVSIPMGGVPVVPMAALIVKIGLRDICPPGHD
ncbi:MAG: hypothetical protein JO023_29605 [Chloroflexi bacterium]|nr:hypothetical protein [Chloroflexota bacterium]